MAKILARGWNVAIPRSTWAMTCSSCATLAGQYYDLSLNRFRGFVSDRGRLATFNLPDALFLSVDDINNRGQVVGSYTTLVDGAYVRHGFLYEDGRVTTLDYADSQYRDTRIIGINESGTWSAPATTGAGASWANSPEAAERSAQAVHVQGIRVFALAPPSVPERRGHVSYSA